MATQGPCGSFTGESEYPLPPKKKPKVALGVTQKFSGKLDRSTSQVLDYGLKSKLVSPPNNGKHEEIKKLVDSKDVGLDNKLPRNVHFDCSRISKKQAEFDVHLLKFNAHLLRVESELKDLRRQDEQVAKAVGLPGKLDRSTSQVLDSGLKSKLVSLPNKGKHEEIKKHVDLKDVGLDNKLRNVHFDCNRISKKQAEFDVHLLTFNAYILQVESELKDYRRQVKPVPVSNSAFAPPPVKPIPVSNSAFVPPPIPVSDMDPAHITTARPTRATRMPHWANDYII